LSWLAWHWQALYVAFFVDQSLIFQKYHLLRNEYVVHNFFNPGSLQFYADWILPAIFTALIIWVVPGLIGLRAFIAEEKYKNQKRRIAIKEAASIEQAETNLEQKSVERIQASVKKAKEEQRLVSVDPTAAWRDDYEAFKKSAIRNQFQWIIDSVYDHNGITKDDFNSYGNEYGFEVPQRMIVYSDTNGLINLVTAPSTIPKISLTEKGKFFVKSFIADKIR
jgi:hypothetical protein